MCNGRPDSQRTSESSSQCSPKILCDFHSLHSYFYWNSLMSGSPQRDCWIFVCACVLLSNCVCSAHRWNYVAVILSIAHSNEMCEMKKKKKKKKEYVQSECDFTHIAREHTHTQTTRYMFARYVFHAVCAPLLFVFLWTFNACFIIHFISLRSVHSRMFSSIGQQRSVSFGSLNSWNCEIVSKQTCVRWS